MSLEASPMADGRILKIHVSGKLEQEDLERFASVAEEQIRQHGAIRILVELHDFAGWSAAALWEDLKFEFKHSRDVDRLAIVSHPDWKTGLSRFIQPFAGAQARHFTLEQADEAWKWVLAGLPSPAGKPPPEH